MVLGDLEGDEILDFMGPLERNRRKIFGHVVCVGGGWYTYPKARAFGEKE